MLSLHEIAVERLTDEIRSLAHKGVGYLSLKLAFAEAMRKAGYLGYADEKVTDRRTKRYLK